MRQTHPFYANELQQHSHATRCDTSGRRRVVYICNCNGIRERDARAAIDAGATKPAEVFRHCQARPQCAKCVCEMRRMIQDQAHALKYAAE